MMLVLGVATSAVHATSYMSLESMYAEVFDRADVITVGQVSTIKLEGELITSVGDWAFVVTGRRLGLPGPLRVITTRTIQTLKGSATERLTVREHAKVQDDTGLFAWPFVPVLAGRSYLLFCERQESGLEVIEYVDITDRPELVQDILPKLRRDNRASPRRRTTRSSGRSARHAPCLRKARAARPAAERVRWTGKDNPRFLFSNGAR